MTEENKKTVLAFIAGLLVGGVLLYIFMEPAAVTTDQIEADTQSEGVSLSEVKDDVTQIEIPSETIVINDEITTAVRGGNVTVSDQLASDSVIISETDFPVDSGWVGVRDFVDGRVTGLLGVVRWSKTEGLLPEKIYLMRSTEAGKTYAVVFYVDNGDKVFSLATDAQIDGVMETFRAE